MTRIAAPYGINRDEGLSVWFLGTLMTLKATGDETEGAFGLIEQTLPAGFVTPLHIHHSEDEAFYLLEGEASFTCNDQTIRAKPGSFVFFPRDLPHWFCIEGTGPAKLLQFNFPAGLENFFVESGELIMDSNEPPAGPPNFEKLALIAGKYNMEILGPPPK